MLLELCVWMTIKPLTVFSGSPVALKGAVYSRFCWPTYKQQQVNHKDVNEREREESKKNNLSKILI